MSDTVIRVDNLGKKYRLGAGAGSHNFREMLTHAASAPLRWLRRSAAGNGSSPQEIWALKDVSFDVRRGDVVGIIGRNGAGKSTLLKILSRITEPTEGSVELRGRVGSLLEVGTGFHPELTGRENIYLNGAILGMRKAEIERKFDEIVAFSEIERFLDTPVKRYSSGMYMRLAFAVAAHLEPEILIVDEVLAVGDAQFQKKCLGKMGEVARQGRTVLFVSHNLLAIQRLCTRAVLLERGKVALTGDTNGCVEAYVASFAASNGRTLSDGIELADLPQGSNELRFLRLRLLDAQGRVIEHIAVGEQFHVEIDFRVSQPLRDLVIGIAFHTREEFPIFATHCNDFGRAYALAKGIWRAKVCVSPNYLKQGHYFISVGALEGGRLVAHVPVATPLRVEPILHGGDAHHDDRIGVLFIPMHWGEPQPVDLH